MGSSDHLEDMTKLIVFGGGTLGGYVGWWLGAYAGFFAAFMLSMVGTGIGMYAGRRFALEHLQ